MNFKNQKYFASCFCSLLSLAINAQITVNFSPTIYGQTLDGLVFAQIVNTSGLDLRITETIRITETSGLNVVTIKTLPFVVTQGASSINRAAFSNGHFNFSNSYYGSALSQSGKLPEGEYEYCFDTEVTGNKPDQIPAFYQNCFNLRLQPMTPLLLINPIDDDRVCNKRPDLIWQLPAPLLVEARSRIILTEIKEKQDVAEAVAYNPPIINQGNVFGNMLLYPPAAPELQEGRKYAWQVTVYSSKTILKKSEIWTFTVQCEDKQPSVGGNSYRELKETDDGNFYIASRLLSFSFNNPFPEGSLDYSIVSLSKGNEKIKGLPKLNVAPGINKYDLDLSQYRSFKKGEEYLLSVRLPNGADLHLRFIYKNE